MNWNPDSCSKLNYLHKFHENYVQFQFYSVYHTIWSIFATHSASNRRMMSITCVWITCDALPFPTIEINDRFTQFFFHINRFVFIQNTFCSCLPSFPLLSLKINKGFLCNVRIRNIWPWFRTPSYYSFLVHILTIFHVCDVTKQ